MFEPVTILAVAIICVILAIYLSVLKKNGWLGSRGSKFYRCPNPECKGIFQKPIELKDLSETPARVYPACPHCGFNLEPVLGSGVGKKLALKITPPAQHKKTDTKIETTKIETTKTEVKADVKADVKAEVKTGRKTEDSAAKVEMGNLEVAGPAENRGKELPQLVEMKTQISADNVEERGKPPVSVQPAQESGEKSGTLLKPEQSPSQEKAPGEEATMPNAESGFSDKSPKGCPHFFGYLRCLPKGSSAPDYCYSCPIMVDCYAIDRAAIDRSLRSLARAIKSEVYE
jgi:hypothetical protein